MSKSFWAHDTILGNMPEVYSSSSIPHPKHPSGEYSDVMRMNTPSKSRCSAFMIRPIHTLLSILEADEKVLMLIRSHPITQVGWVLIAIVLALVPLLAPLFPIPSILPAQFEVATLGLWYLFVLGLIFDGFLGWYYNVFIITDERIIDVDFIHLVYKNITATKIDHIEDVTYSVSGFLPSLLNYGNVLIETAGEAINLEPDGTMAAIEMLSTPQPAIVAKLINELMLQEEQEKIEGRTH